MGRPLTKDPARFLRHNSDGRLVPRGVTRPDYFLSSTPNETSGSPSVESPKVKDLWKW
jgi:hypothetical protein